MIKPVFQKLLYFLVKGALVFVPIAGTVFLMVWIVASLDKALNLTAIFLEDDQGNPIHVPGIGILTALVLLIIVGAVFTNLVTDPIRLRLDRMVNRIPLFSTLYSSIKDFTEAFVGDAKKFNEPVLVLVNETGLKKIGFLTQHHLDKIGLDDEVLVYFPYSYSFAGQVVVVKSANVQKLDMSATDAMKLVISGGVSGLE